MYADGSGRSSDVDCCDHFNIPSHIQGGKIFLND